MLHGSGTDYLPAPAERSSIRRSSSSEKPGLSKARRLSASCSTELAPTITELTRSAVKTMLGFEHKHIGVICDEPEEALKHAKKFSALFGWALKEGNNSTFAGTAVECMKAPYLGKNGHIAVGTTSVVRAKAYLESQGFEFDESTAKYKGEKLNAIYLKDEIGGFAIHLVNK